MASRHNWECSNCQGINGERDVNCDVCGHKRQHIKGGGHNQPRKSSGGLGENRAKYDWESVGRRENPQCGNGPRDGYDDQAGAKWKCKECTYFNTASSPKCKMCRRGSRSNEPVTCPSGPARVDRNGYSHPKRSSPPPVRNDVTSSYDKPRDRPSTRGTGYDRSRGRPRDGRQSLAGRHQSPRSRRRQIHKPMYEDCVDSRERRLVLLGKTGCGKSATGNSILSGDFFRSMVSGASVTQSCRRGVVQRNGKEIHVVDTPGVFDTEVDNDNTTKEIVKCVGITAPGPHAFLLIVRIGRFTAEERDSVELFIEHFGRSVEKYMIVLFTGMDDLNDERMTLDDHLRRIPSSLVSILERCGGRCVGFNNKGTAREISRQVDELMEMVEDLFKHNNGRYYTNTMYMEAENVIRTREAEIRSMAEVNRRREREELEDDNERHYGHELKKQEEQQYELRRALQETESRTGQEDSKRRIRTEEIDADIKSIHKKIDQERQAGGKVSRHLQNRLSDLKRERNRIEGMEGNARKMQAEVKSLREKLKNVEQKVSKTRREQNDDKERRLKELEKKHVASENNTREVVRKEVEKGETNIGSQLLNTVIGLGKMVWKGLTKLF
ncbi:GTPase IMAP family member 4-like [Mizuhopecten yessoensis]|uniref:GTPase IMAP family member 4 n=1 Tax=Mizuhopecten yessoensis TaxID=6573 RepID=A0A210PEX9_MIZYE|nr:GTPase IMAP family member 4-like [Mizuhopecten yessoensis]OWF35048.1 GTPase IMAP family member 4 [Mizuhopecten yessoensis]